MTRNDIEEMKKLKKWLDREFKIKDLCSHSRNGIFISQKNIFLVF